MIRPQSDDRFDPFSANDRAWLASILLIPAAPASGQKPIRHAAVRQSTARRLLRGCARTELFEPGERAPT
jgi:hypothetical protein